MVLSWVVDGERYVARVELELVTVVSCRFQTLMDVEVFPKVAMTPFL
jgi:hypothetical protein